MTVVTQSTRLTNRTVLPQVVNSRDAGTRVVQKVDVIATIPTGSAADYSILDISVPVNAVITSIKVATDALGTSCTMDVGLYQQNPPLGSVSAASYTAILDNAFANNIDVHAATAETEYRFSALDIDTANDPVWKNAGLSAAPSYNELFIGLTFDAQVATAGGAMVKVTYLI